MAILKTKLNRKSKAFTENVKHMKESVGQYLYQLKAVQERTQDASVKRHMEKGKLFVRDRIKKLLDPGTPFLELSPLAAFKVDLLRNEEESVTLVL